MSERGESEWREVRKRGVVSTFSERKPARQSYTNPRSDPKPQTDGFYIGKDRRSYRKESSGKRQDMEPKFDTFFFNIPEDCSVDFLKRKFGTIRRVRDVFCPRKRDLKGKPFGFVRFDKTQDQAGLLAELNSLWIGSYKIRVFKPRFSRTISEARKEEEKESELKRKKSELKQKQRYLIQGGLRDPEITFAEALTGSKKDYQDSLITRLNAEEIAFQPDEQELEWLHKAFTGYVKSCFEWE